MGRNGYKARHFFGIGMWPGAIGQQLASDFLGIHRTGRGGLGGHNFCHAQSLVFHGVLHRVLHHEVGGYQGGCKDASKYNP
jgi:hypothetical protein